MPEYRKTTSSMLQKIMKSKLSSPHASLGIARFLRSPASNTRRSRHPHFLVTR
ncbi:unnamed protein product [Acanthoscelides obtectus]|uniref:Uncharacterized protein n=1 Tax=Acanthoscelides obtectus TaxID=200917 RepID=A0A9P0JTS3_ACAOB|nr:unnamed protein product [Acanthoscelides obtectus]CAK1642256.1 hypothetical protein AOBTE_LOCUS12926 [Acanthoscelides obtectus]